jgi:hypothetical protein
MGQEGHRDDWSPTNFEATRPPVKSLYPMPFMMQGVIQTALPKSVINRPENGNTRCADPNLSYQCSGLLPCMGE